MHIDFILIVPQCVMLHFRKNLFVNMFCINLWLNLCRISISTMIKPWPNFRRSSLNNYQGRLRLEMRDFYLPIILHFQD